MFFIAGAVLIAAGLLSLAYGWGKASTEDQPQEQEQPQEQTQEPDEE